ncbi:MAG: hypothetical protein COW56_15030 [Rhodocyclales bacterium CG17_big_fil_post_rev_8_21_14_2_50_68_7]|nr:MAG: hypothetical protein COW56_15030 [Rhodocyclales bacterium CG17_big_fil_post_rev_8_21_14_2_50_68_7]PIX76215.1 MAG: hypothetical protein COZ38_01505 [Rhodocyclales bacterium CG_4_10_14_3_um_filter_68_10]PJA56539.1 MAG: hypothetical protein CO164_12315 [Rhodocyclales bacterium CG_4_9_14_3_um_filter_68_10]
MQRVFEEAEMKSPKMLPWLARKTGVPIGRAERLWAEALRHARLRTGAAATPETWRLAVERLNELLAQQAPFSPIVHCQVRLWLLPLSIWRDVSVTASRSWLRML